MITCPGFAPAAPPCELCQELEHPFSCAEMRERESDVRKENGRQRYVREIETFHNRLRSKQYIRLTFAHFFEKQAHLLRGRERIAVGAQNASGWKYFAKNGFNFLRSSAYCEQVGRRTVRAVLRKRSLHAG